MEVSWKKQHGKGKLVRKCLKVQNEICICHSKSYSVYLRILHFFCKVNVICRGFNFEKKNIQNTGRLTQICNIKALLQ